MNCMFLFQISYFFDESHQAVWSKAFGEFLTELWTHEFHWTCGFTRIQSHVHQCHVGTSDFDVLDESHKVEVAEI